MVINIKKISHKIILNKLFNKRTILSLNLLLVFLNFNQQGFWGRGDIVASVHREGEVVSTSNEEEGIRIRARLGDASIGRLSQYVISQQKGSL